MDKDRKTAIKNVIKASLMTVLVCSLIAIMILDHVYFKDPEVPSTFDGIAVDSEGNLYLGENDWIGVFDENGVRVRKIEGRMIWRYYVFTIIDDQIHIWDVNSSHWILSLDGETEERIGKEKRPIANSARFRFTAEDGRHYVLKNPHSGRAKVICYYPDGSEEVIYREPFWPSFIRTTAMPATGILFLLAYRPEWFSKETIRKLNIQILKKHWRPEKYDK